MILFVDMLKVFRKNFKITGEPPSFASLKIFKQLEAGTKCVSLSLKKQAIVFWSSAKIVCLFRKI